MTDIFINFNSAYYRPDFELETNRSAIACNYLQGWFFIDFVSILPFDLLMAGFVSSEEEGTENLN